MNFYVYVLKSLVNGDHYKGQTDNIDRRFEEHQQGKCRATKKFKTMGIIICSNLRIQKRIERNGEIFKNLYWTRNYKAIS